MSKVYVLCEKCNKKLIERRPDGSFYFCFGRAPVFGIPYTPVEIKGFGNIQMKCLRKSCNHWNNLNFIPEVETDGTDY